ncbi:MAG: hypothetical protein WCD18_03945 [Thermosynechococcaceae cyanobacterium]
MVLVEQPTCLYEAIHRILLNQLDDLALHQLLAISKNTHFRASCDTSGSTPPASLSVRSRHFTKVKLILQYNLN